MFRAIASTWSLIFLFVFASAGVCKAQSLTAQQLQALFAAGPSYYSNGVAGALGANAVQGNGGDISGTVWTAQGGSTPRSVSSRGADTINIMDYGAKCDGVTDDSIAISSAVAVLRYRVIVGLPSKLVLGRGRCNINSTINMTGISSYFIVIDGSQSIINCSVSGSICIDAMGSSHLKWENLHIDTGNIIASIGLQIARSAPSSPCGEQRFYAPVITGNFSIAAFYNGACETVSMFDPHFENHSSSAQSYAAIYDGANHWNVQSSYLPTSWGVDVSNSFNENTTFGGTFVTNAGTPIWMEAASRHRFYGTYALTNSTGPAFTLYLPQNGNSISQLFVDMHFEANPSSIFFITGSTPKPVIYGLTYIDHLCQATASVFATDTNVSSLTMLGTDVKIPFVLQNPVLFSKPSIVQASGSIRVPATTWNLTSASYSGLLDLNGVISFYGLRTPNVARVALTTAPYSVPLNDDVVRFTQAAELSSTQVTLPTTSIDGYVIQLVNYSAKIDALTFNPSVAGWSNGSALSAFTGVRVRWDSTAQSWYREQ